MRKAFFAIPIVAAGAIATAVSSASVAGATPALIAPIPTEYPWCALDMYCYDDDLDLTLNSNRDRHTPNYGGGAAFGN